jgi:hypothetical protein
VNDLRLSHVSVPQKLSGLTTETVPYIARIIHGYLFCELFRLICAGLQGMCPNGHNSEDS